MSIRCVHDAPTSAPAELLRRRPWPARPASETPGQEVLPRQVLLPRHLARVGASGLQQLAHPLRCGCGTSPGHGRGP